VVVIDGASVPAGLATGCGHGTAWFARQLGTQLIALLNTQGGSVDATHLYWTNSSNGTISRANLDGSNRQVIVSGPLLSNGVAVDASHLYWANSGTNATNGAIMVANLDGSGVRALVSGQNHPAGVAVTSTNVYWSNTGNGALRQADLNGGNVQDLFDFELRPVQDPWGVAVGP
jgi:sugar lactone lactonase YvrE